MRKRVYAYVNAYVYVDAYASYLILYIYILSYAYIMQHMSARGVIIMIEYSLITAVVIHAGRGES